MDEADDSWKANKYHTTTSQCNTEKSIIYSGYKGNQTIIVAYGRSMYTKRLYAGYGSQQHYLNYSSKLFVTHEVTHQNIIHEHAMSDALYKT